MAEVAYGYTMSGLFGYSHMTGGYAGGQAEYVRVPYSDVGPIVIPDGLEDEKVLFLSDILPTGWMAAENCDIEEGDTVDIDIPNRSIHVRVSDEVLAQRRAAMDAKGSAGWKPVNRERKVSAALKAYAAMTTSASRGAVRDVTQLER